MLAGHMGNDTQTRPVWDWGWLKRGQLIGIYIYIIPVSIPVPYEITPIRRLEGVCFPWSKPEDPKLQVLVRLGKSRQEIQDEYSRLWKLFARCCKDFRLFYLNGGILGEGVVTTKAPWL